VERRWSDADQRERDVCMACGTVMYINPKIIVWCFAHWKKQIVLCRRAHEPARGLWVAPGGFVEAGETLEEATAREVREEAGFEVPVSSLILYRVVSLPHMNQVWVGFRARLVAAPMFNPGPEVSEVRLFGEHDTPYREIAFRELHPDVPEDFFRYLKARKFPVVAVTVRLLDDTRRVSD
jgi:ADP-ribose pyrophosphatase YjhB (NUDIX family)